MRRDIITQSNTRVSTYGGGFVQLRSKVSTLYGYPEICIE